MGVQWLAMERLLRGVARFGPPIVWMGVIAVLSSSLLGADRTESYVYALLVRLLPWAGPDALRGVHTVLRKMGHVVEYGILAVLWLRALAPGRSPGAEAAWAVGLSALYAVVDEARQGLTPNRSPSAWDVGIDTAGAGLAVAWLQAPGRPAQTVVRLARCVTLLLTIGTLASAAVDWSLGLPVWDLVPAALGLVVAGWGLRSVERRWRRVP